MYRFLHPHTNGTLTDIMIGADDLAGAFEQFRAIWWRPNLTGCVGVWRNSCLEARIVPVLNVQTGELEPLLQELKP